MSGTSEDQLRAGAYSLLARLLRETPDIESLGLLLQIEAEPGSNEGEIAEGLAIMKLAAKQAEPELLEREFNDLFIGVGRGEIIPFASWYLTGFLMEKPLSQLRDDLSNLGFERQEDTHEPEDHIAALSEVMSMLITSGKGYALQAEFYQTHLEAWVDRFFADLVQAKNACFYKSVGQFGRAFTQFEKHYLQLQV